ncbi:uncharacterized protein LOC128502371 [Spea bombifrons]|uniref:uncharacterized protein LOC128502371 n=1 Tax=Spea bombifrons TaxID=233779 RepID=UPI00234A9BB1|nr:uncharacterized protein LOC128502371 [Spea bombifrons]
MGRLDEQAKNRIVVLRKAGLSFRKIKKVLELDNIKVTPQAIYLFLKRKNVEPEKSPVVPPSSVPKEKPWESGHPWALVQENGGQGHGVKDRRTLGNKHNEMANSGRSQEAVREEGIKIVSVTSLSNMKQEYQPPSTTTGISQRQTLRQTNDCVVRQAHPLTATSLRQPAVLPATSHHSHGRARTPLPGPRNPALLVTKKIVDRAINVQKKVIFQNGTPMLAHSGHYPPSTTVTHRPPTLRPVAAACSRIRDASTQTAPPPSANAEQFETIRGELQRLTQAVQTLMDRQSRWEQEQNRQRQCNHQEVLLQIQQLGATLTARSSYGQEPDTPLPDIGQFKMELL